MSDNEDLKKALTQTLTGIDLLIQRENHAAIATKIASDAAKKLEATEAQIRMAEAKLMALNMEKDALLAKATATAADIIKGAETKEKEATDRLFNAKKMEQTAQDKLEEAKVALGAHQNALNEVLSQKEKLRAALAG